MKNTLIILAFGALIVLSHKPRKIKTEQLEFKYDRIGKLTKMDAG